jgi:hypothetical protein
MHAYTADQLRRLTNDYREHFKAGEDSATVVFILEWIRDAERRLAEIERAPKEKGPRGD